MSTMIQKNPGADFKEVGLGRKLPAGDKCLAWFEFGVSERLSIRNHAQAGSRGHLIPGVTVGAASISAGAFITELANDYTAGDATIVLFCTPSTTGSAFQIQLKAGGVTYSNDATNESTPLRYSTGIFQRVNSAGTAPHDFLGQFGTYDSTTPAAGGTNNSLSKLNAVVEAMCVTQEVVAATRVQTLSFRNGATYVSNSPSTNTAAVNHIRDTRTTIPFQIDVDGGGLVHSFLVFAGLLTVIEKNAIYALEKARLTALGVTAL